jgi:integrase/recombinase XerD
LTEYSTNVSVIPGRNGNIADEDDVVCREVEVMNMLGITIKTGKAREAFLEAKADLSHRTLEQYSGALDLLEQECRRLPKAPEIIRKALNRAPTIWVKSALWAAWSTFFRWCHEEYGAENPMTRVDRPKIPDVEMRALEAEDLPQVLASAGDIRDKCIVSLGIDAGIRASEFGRIRICDVTGDTIKVWGKGNKRLSVPISPETRHLLQLLIDQDGKGGPQSLLFPGRDGRPISRFAVYHIVSKAMKKAGISGPKMGPHCLRHSLGKNYIANGGDPFSLKRIMRHRNLATTQKYVNLAMKDIIEKHHRYSPARDAIRGAQGILLKHQVEEIVKEHDPGLPLADSHLNAPEKQQDKHPSIQRL